MGRRHGRPEDERSKPWLGQAVVRLELETGLGEVGQARALWGKGGGSEHWTTTLGLERMVLACPPSMELDPAPLDIKMLTPADRACDTRETSLLLTTCRPCLTGHFPFSPCFPFARDANEDSRSSGRGMLV